MSDMRLVIATHKQYRMPDDPIYLPLHVGHAGKQDIGYLGDDTGENISEYNSRFYELTGLYWAWKNLDADYIGLVHYRRHFTTQSRLSRLGKDKFSCVLKGEELRDILEKYDLILPKERKYYIESLYSHFCYHGPDSNKIALEVLRQVIQEYQPEYTVALETVMARSHGHMFNMFIMKKELLDAYCSWAFPILFELDKRLMEYSNRRFAGVIGEFMLDIWNEKAQIPYKELPVIFIEKQNWLIKGGRFLYRKIFSKHDRGGSMNGISI